MSSSVNEKSSPFVTHTHTHKSFNISCLWFLLGMVLLFVSPLGLRSQTLAPEVENFIYKAIYLPGSDKQANPPLGSPEGFMARPNGTIINDIRRLNCNTVFLYVKLHPSNDPNVYKQTYGLFDYTYNQTGQTYIDKVTDFIDKCTDQGIKVFAWNFDDTSHLSNFSKATVRMEKIRYYQVHIREEGSPYKNRKCHFQGVVSNYEPWTLLSYKDNFCTSSNRHKNDSILSVYLDLIKVLRQKFESTDPIFTNNSFLNPLIYPGGTLQPRDNLFMGTVQWYWHYYYEKYKNDAVKFSNGNFSLYVGYHNGDNYFDIIIPQTYCSQSDEDCLSAPCIDPSLTSFCKGNYTKTETEFVENGIYDEGTGKCYSWFDKHMLSDFMFSSYPPYVVPTTAAPMLYGHTAFMPSITKEDLLSLRDASAYLAKVCYKNDNYRGSVIFNYPKAWRLPSGPVSAPFDPCGAVPDNSLNELTLSNNMLVDAAYISATDELQIKYYGNPVPLKISVFDLNLNPVLTKTESGNEFAIAASSMNGFYILTVHNENQKLIFRKVIYIRK